PEKFPGGLRFVGFLPCVGVCSLFEEGEGFWRVVGLDGSDEGPVTGVLLLLVRDPQTGQSDNDHKQTTQNQYALGARTFHTAVFASLPAIPFPLRQIRHGFQSYPMQTRTFYLRMPGSCHPLIAADSWRTSILYFVIRSPWVWYRETVIARSEGP